MSSTKEQISKLKLYSVGLVSENKKLSSDEIYVIPIEVTPVVEGEINNDTKDVSVGGVDRNGEPYEVKVKTGSSIVAEWLRLGNTNRRTSPDVRRGERVLLYRFADSDKFYWESMGMDDHLRGLETVVYSWSNTKTEWPAADATKPEQCYTLEIDTHKKLVTFKTNKDTGQTGNGEPYAYTFQLNTAEGYFTITDDVGNYIELDSAETKITLKNKDTTKVELNKENILVDAPNNITVTCGNTFSLKAGNEVLVDAKNLIKLTCGGSIIKMVPGRIDIND